MNTMMPRKPGAMWRRKGNAAFCISGDVRDSGFCRLAAEQVNAHVGRIDILVNNAAFQEHANSLLDLTEERFDLPMQTNVYGYFHMAKQYYPI